MCNSHYISIEHSLSKNFQNKCGFLEMEKYEVKIRDYLILIQ